MVLESGDIWPQSSGSASLGAEMTNGGVTRVAQPFASVHQNSGVFYSPFGISGVMRYTAGQETLAGQPIDVFGIYSGFEMSIDGGSEYIVKIGGTQNTAADIPAGAAIVEALAGSQLRLVGSGIKLRSGRQLALEAWNASGKLEYRFGPRQAWYVKTTISSLGGPNNDGYWPIPHSGNISQMIAQATGFHSVSGVTPLGFGSENAEGEPTTIEPYAAIHMMSGIIYSPFGTSGVIRYTAGDEVESLAANIFGIYKGMEISVDGGTRYILKVGGTQGSGTDIPNGAAVVQALLASELRLVGSGVRVDSNGNIALISTNNISNQLGGTYVINCAGNLIEVINGNASRTSSSHGHTITNNFYVASLLGNIAFETLSDIGDITLNAVGQLHFHAFNHSGIMMYNFGPYQSFYIKTTHANTGGPFNDGYWPIAHSGNILQMIQERQAGIGSGLQSAYQTQRFINITANPGALEFISNTAKTKFSTFGTQAELNVSGLFLPPTLANLERGDLYMMNHSVISGIVGTTTDAVVKAKALGLGSLVIQTGSGIINLSVGSGIAQFSNSTAMLISTVNQTVPLDTIVHTADQNYGLGTGLNSGVITVFSPGLYKINFKVGCEKTTGTTPQECVSTLLYNNSFTPPHTTIASICFDKTDASISTTSTVTVLNLDAGDTIRIQTKSSLSGGNNCSVFAGGGATLVIEKVGPKRGTAGS